MQRNVWLTMAWIMLIGIMLFTASCNKQAVQTQAESTPAPQVQQAPPAPPVENEEDTQLMEQLQTEAVARESTQTAFVAENIHFAFDSAVLSTQAQQVLTSMAEYLRTNPDVVITVEGHCDERGSDAYNMALGERRASSVKEFLTDLGIGTDRLKVVSYGESQPIAMGGNETSWAQNRRAEFVVN